MGPHSTHRTVLEVVVHHWPLTIFVPAVLLLILTLALVTRVCDRRDEARAGRTVPRSTAVTIRRWGRQVRCDCSWHTVGFAVGVVSPPVPRRPVPTRSDAI